MKILLLICFSFIYFKSYQCNSIKNLVETVANEVNKVAGYIENVGSNKSETVPDNDTTQNVLSKVIITELANSTNIHKKNNTPVQVNVDITLVVNYNVPKTNPNEPVKDKGINTTNNPLNITKTVTDPSVTEQSSIKIASIDFQKVDTNIKFPGPMNSPIVTYNEGVVVLKTNDTHTNDKVLFPDSKMNTTKPDCPDGMFLTENGYCLIEEKERPTHGDNDEVARSAFSGRCLQGYARALDGSCQEIIED